MAEKYIIVGGTGHTTPDLRAIVHAKCPSIATEQQPEAIVFQHYLQEKYQIQADYLETESTNCGNNITNMLDLIHREGLPHDRIILCQDATMMRRMGAGLRKYAPEVKPLLFATYQAVVTPEMTYKDPIDGMWSVDRYINLLMGEIPRLTDDENGYGPKGKDFIAHVDIPEAVVNAFQELHRLYEVREAFGG